MFVVPLHIAAQLGALGLGVIVLTLPKGTPIHKALGRSWAMLMVVGALSSFWIYELRPGQFSLIHLLSIWTLIALAAAIFFIRRGNRRAHMGFMIGTFLGALGAGGATLIPGRLIGDFLFG